MITPLALSRCSARQYGIWVVTPDLIATSVFHWNMCTHDRIADEREAALDRREAAVTIREASLAHLMDIAQKAVAAGDRRDFLAGARDEASDGREHYLDRAQFLAHDGNNTYGDNVPKHRRHAALDRAHARDDREASQDDRIALVEALT